MPTREPPREPMRLPLAVDRASPVPLYFQLARQLETAITEGALAPGSLLGNEIEPAGAALLTVQRTTYDDRGRTIEFGSHVYRASRYTFEFRLLVGS